MNATDHASPKFYVVQTTLEKFGLIWETLNSINTIKDKYLYI